MNAVQQDAAEFRRLFEQLRAQVARVIVGHEDIVEHVLVAVFCGGNCLLEGVPGLGKTMLIRTLAQALELGFNRVQFTPDLMPSDIIGVDMITDDGKGSRVFRFQQGPVFTNLLLADEINRATPKTQSALLEVMQEHQVTVGGRRYAMEEPFFVLATQNPIEQEGTYPLPEAQLDRFFFKLTLKTSSREELTRILQRTTEAREDAVEKVAGGQDILRWRRFCREVVIAPAVRDYAVRLVLATHADSPFGCDAARRCLRFGASPRAAQALVLAGKVKALIDERYNVAFEDIRSCALPVLRHRIILNFEAEAEQIGSDDVIAQVLEATPREAPTSIPV